MVEEGNMVGTSSPLIAIVNDNLIYADIAVPEKYYADFRNKGDSIRALVKPVAYPDQEAFSGRVTNVASIIDPQSRTFNVEIAGPNSANLLTPGMYVNVDLILSEIETDFLLPVTSVVYREGRQVVFIVTEKNSYHVEMRPVKTGLSDSGMVQIIEGIGTDDQVVVQGNAFLEHGQQVRLIKES
jgi:RND family efflux transporter MFP subunit